MRIGIRAEVAVQLFMLFDDDQNGFLDLCMLSIIQLMVGAVSTLIMYNSITKCNISFLACCVGGINMYMHDHVCALVTGFGEFG